ncbi:hypothetical protein NCS56_00858400 [Fusarium sp. Ph1]|nr:hypothetical protein NCS56_00858400 [Fusarium sp. Ph1]
MHPQTDCRFFSLPPEIRIIIQRDYLEEHPKIQTTGTLKGSLEEGKIKWYKGISIAPPLMLTCVKMYKDMRLLAFQDMTIFFPFPRNYIFELRMTLPPPRESLQYLTIRMDQTHRAMKAYRSLTAHLLEGPSLKLLRIRGFDYPALFSCLDPQCVCGIIRASIERRQAQGQIVIVSHPRSELDRMPFGDAFSRLVDLDARHVAYPYSSESVVLFRPRRTAFSRVRDRVQITLEDEEAYRRSG